MKRVFFQNLNVGSAIEYMGNIVLSWLNELDVEVMNYKYQDRSTTTFSEIYSFKPDLIVTNEYYNRPMVAALMYRSISNVKMIHIEHVWKRLFITESDKNQDIYSFMSMQECFNTVDHIFCVNYMPDYKEWPKNVAHKISNRYYATDPTVFNVSKPWEDRKKLFCYIGNILPHKLSSDFLAKIVGTDIIVDCYGRRTNKDRYNDIFQHAIDKGNINYKGLIPQEQVARIMNEYKYLVLPHDGYEPFNWVMKQCMFCGTIPLVLNDRKATRYDGNWIDWANGLYFGCKYTSDLLKNLQMIRDEHPDDSQISKYICTEANRRFSYQEFKDEFQEKARGLLDG